MAVAHSLPVEHHRSHLAFTADAFERGALTVGFIGGSITEAGPGTRWPEPVIAWLLERYPDLELRVENAAIGATGSVLAVFRVDAHILARACDLVFVEFSVNDESEDRIRRARAREGLLRKLLPHTDVVLVHTHSPGMQEAWVEGRIPDSISDFETLAEHYDVSSVWVGLHALRETMRGRMRYVDWLPDGTHPEARGSLSYAEAVIGFLQSALSKPTASSADTVLPEPLDPEHWGDARVIPTMHMKTSGPWVHRRSVSMVWVEHVLTTGTLGARLQVPVSGRVIAIALDFGRESADLRFRLGKGPWRALSCDRPEWSPDWGWLRAFVLHEGRRVDDRLEIEVIWGGTGTELRVAWVGEVG